MVHAQSLGGGAPPGNDCCSSLKPENIWVFRVGNSEHQDGLNDDDWKSSDHTTKQESQDTLVEALADKMLQRVQQKLRTQERGAHASGSLSGSTSGGESLHRGSEGKKKNYYI